MDILVGHASALEFWRTVGPRFLRDERARRLATGRARKALADGAKPRLAGEGRRPAGCSLPLDVLIADERVRTTNAQVKSCLWSVPLPDASFVDAGEGLLVSAPEFAFLQMANRLSLAQLIQLGFELCGTYALVDPRTPAVQREAPLTSVAKLRSFLEDAPPAHGCKKALRAVRFVQDGSASMMETLTAMLLCLPYRLGGYGLDRPLLNHRIDVPCSLRRMASKSYCVCDLHWPEAKLAVEYDSGLWHDGSDDFVRDSKRRNTLIALGLTVVTMTAHQVLDGGELNKAAHLLAQITGKRLRYRDPDFTRAHLALRAELLQAFTYEEAGG